MGLIKPPGIVTFVIATVLAAVAFAAQLGFAAFAPVHGAQFWLMSAAFVLLFLGSVTRGL